MTAKLQTTEQTTAQALIQILTLNKNTGAALEKLLKLPLLDADNKIPAGVLRIVGALSAGHIIESGDNANGNYVRFADGTQICTADLTISTSINYTLGSVFGSLPWQWTYPAEFINIPSAVSGGHYCSGVAEGWCEVISRTTDASVRFYCGSKISAQNTFLVRLLAIGRWKEQLG